MVKIRLRRTGAKKKPHYRLVVADIRAPRDGRFIEIVGHYNPRTEPSTVKVYEDRVLYWLSVGAQPTDPVKRLLENLGTLDRFARLKQGADLDQLVAEAEAAHKAGNGEQPKAQAGQSQAKPAKTKAAAKAEAAEPETSADTEDVPEESAETSSEDDNN